jgi:spore coat protein H
MRLGLEGVAVRRSVPGVSLALLTVLSCRAPFDPADRNPDWTTASHGLTAPNYAVVFPADSLNRIDIIMSAGDWAGIRQDMTALWGFDFGAKTHPCCGPYPAGEPRYVAVTVKFNGKEWKHVGFRLKGNSTLHHPWNLGVAKLPFRLKFDAFEDAYPETWNQRFYGFKDLSTSASVFDESFIRERVASDLFRQAGVPAARTASYRVYVDFGQGLAYNGVYTMIELPEDTGLRDQLGENTGNVYKPESTFGFFVQSEFHRQNNDSSQDFSDVQAFITALNNTALQASNRAQWRANLEATFDVDQYLKFLAVNNSIVAWDTYGAIAHNYYLYNHSSKKLTWVPWDLDFAFNWDPGVTGEVPRTSLAVSLTMNEVDSYWPLIRYVMDDPVYFARYRALVATFYNDIFTQAKVDALIDKYHGMIAPYAIGANGEQPGRTFLNSPGDFLASPAWIKNYVAGRRAVIGEFLR